MGMVSYKNYIGNCVDSTRNNIFLDNLKRCAERLRSANFWLVAAKNIKNLFL